MKIEFCWCCGKFFDNRYQWLVHIVEERGINGSRSVLEFTPERIQHPRPKEQEGDSALPGRSFAVSGIQSI